MKQISFKTTLLLSFLLFILSLFACTKDSSEASAPTNSRIYLSTATLNQAKKKLKDPTTINFFDLGYALRTNVNVSPVVSGRSDEELINGVAYELLRLNENYNIASSLISKVGFPYWSRSEIFINSENETPVVLLPFAHLDSDSVEAVLLATPLADTIGWYTTIFKRKDVDSLIAATVVDAGGLGFKVVSFVKSDFNLFGRVSQSHIDWIHNVLGNGNIVPVAQDRCGLYVSWCTDLSSIPQYVLPFNDNRVNERGIDCWLFNIPCTGNAASGAGGTGCYLSENYIWVCDYSNTNEANGGGSGGGSSNPGNTGTSDVGTNILNLYNNNVISEEVMNQLLTIHAMMGLSNSQVNYLIANGQHINSIASFLINYGHELGAKEHAADYLKQLIDDPNYQGKLIINYSDCLNSPPETPPITDRKAALDAGFGTSCSNCTYSVVVYIDQPSPGSRDIYDWSRGGGSKPYTGHTFFQLSQTNSTGQTVTQAIGFYPIAWPSGNQDVPGYFYNEDSNTEYNIKVAFSVNNTQFTAIRNKIEGIYVMFNAGYNNCTSSTILVLNAAGLHIPATSRYQWPIGNISSNPADLGEDLRNNHQGGQFTTFSTPQKFSVATCH